VLVLNVERSSPQSGEMVGQIVDAYRFIDPERWLNIVDASFE